MQIGNGNFNGDHQTVVIDHKVCWLMAKPFLTFACPCSC